MEVYLDNSATTRCSREAAAVMASVLTTDYGNPSSMHRMGMAAENRMRRAAEQIAGTLRCQEKELVFTSGGTESNNLAICGAAEANRRRGRHLITSAVEHPSVLRTMKRLSEQGFEVTYLPVNRFGEISVEELKEAVRPDTILVSLMQVNNEIGALCPTEEAASAVKSVNPDTLFHVDAIQSYGKMRIFPGRMGIDLLSVSGHKFHGPKGAGFLYVRDRTKLKPLLCGGGQQRGVRSGTENVPAIAGLGAAAAAAWDGLEDKVGHMFALREHFIETVTEIAGVSVNGRRDRQCAPHIVSVSAEGVRAEVLLHALEERGVYVSAGSACSSNRPAVSATLSAIGLPRTLLDSTVRVSFCADNTREEIDYALGVFAELIPMLQKYKRH